MVEKDVHRFSGYRLSVSAARDGRLVSARGERKKTMRRKGRNREWTNAKEICP